MCGVSPMKQNKIERSLTKTLAEKFVSVNIRSDTNALI